MVQSVTLPLLFVAAGADADAEGGRASASEIAAFAELWRVRFESVEVRAPARAPGYARNVALRIEALLESARTARATLADAESAPALSEAYRLLYAHPELPQAAWLMAELLTLEAELAERAGSPVAGELLGRALALEGPRQAPFADRESAPLPAVPSASLRVEVAGTGLGDELHWDGEARTPPFTAPAGEHHLRVLRGERLRWAGWVFVSENAHQIALDLPPIAACSAEDLGDVRDGALGPIAPAEVSCPEWAAARRHAGRLEIALCARARCGGWHAARAPADPFQTPAQVLDRSGFPGWASWLLAGAGAAAATSVVLWQAGAFDAEDDPGERWVYRGFD